MHRAGFLLVVALPIAAHAAHPLITEDTATQGRGNVELEIGNAWTRDGADRSYELGPQLSYGLLPQLDLILRPTWLDQRSTGEGLTLHARGAGDTAADVKWRFFTRNKMSLAVRAGLDAPTGDADRGLGLGKPSYHGLLAASVDLAPFAVHSNLGYTRARADTMSRRDLFHASAAAMWTVDAFGRRRGRAHRCDLYREKGFRRRSRLPDAPQSGGSKPGVADRDHRALGLVTIDRGVGRSYSRPPIAARWPAATMRRGSGRSGTT